MNLNKLIHIGDDIVNSIDKNRLANDLVLRNNVKKYQKLRRASNRSAITDLDIMQEISTSIREIEKRLDIVSPN